MCHRKVAEESTLLWISLSRRRNVMQTEIEAKGEETSEGQARKQEGRKNDQRLKALGKEVQR
jgi:hypothetical protein